MGKTESGEEQNIVCVNRDKSACWWKGKEETFVNLSCSFYNFNKITHLSMQVEPNIMKENM